MVCLCKDNCFGDSVAFKVFVRLIHQIERTDNVTSCIFGLFVGYVDYVVLSRGTTSML